MSPEAQWLVQTFIIAPTINPAILVIIAPAAFAACYFIAGAFVSRGVFLR